MTILCAGLGGGLDVLNAAAPYFAAISSGKNAYLGSIKTAPLSVISKDSPFAQSGTLIHSRSRVDFTGRYAEPEICAQLGLPLLYFAQTVEGKTNHHALRQSLEAAIHKFNIQKMLFVDGGGDSLILQSTDGCDTSETTDPFSGGDAISLEAISNMPQAYLGIIAAGLDIDIDKFHDNITLLARRGGYLGRVNLLTLEKDSYRLTDMIPFQAGFLEQYKRLAHNILVSHPSHVGQPHRFVSHTGLVTYHALSSEFGIKPSFVPWKVSSDNKPHVEVTPEHAWMYFVNAGMIHPLKKELSASANFG